MADENTQDRMVFIPKGHLIGQSVHSPILCWVLNLGTHVEEERERERNGRSRNLVYLGD